MNNYRRNVHEGAMDDWFRVLSLWVLSERLEEDMFVMDERVEWIEINEEKIITSEETLDAIASMIYNIFEWIDAENVFVEYYWNEK